MVGLALTAMTMPASAAVEAITGVAVTSGGGTNPDGTLFQNMTYTSSGLLGTGTLHTDFTIDFSTSPVTTSGFPVLTRSDGATLSGTGVSTVDLSQYPYAAHGTFTLANGTGALAGVTAVIELTGFSRGPEVIGDEQTMSGTVTAPTQVPTDKADCKHRGWSDLTDVAGVPFSNQRACMAFLRGS